MGRKKINKCKNGQIKWKNKTAQLNVRRAVLKYNKNETKGDLFPSDKKKR